METVYFPSCNFTKASPQAAKKLRDWIKEAMPVAGCCRTEKRKYPTGSRALYFCQACRETLEKRFPELEPENLFVWLDREECLALPDYHGLMVSVQDCWRDREHPEIHQAVRNLLCKMEIDWQEIPESHERANYCGNLHFEPERPEAAALVKARPGQELYQFPEEEQRRIFAEQLEKHGGLPVLCYCNRCKLGMETAGGKAVHLMELLMGTY
ncbi:hypothetical protein D7X94_06805 [Acutalibacter sp. 1XD8-33]|uniref:hypothetical protein n=1 Tax=Acutalibacter sp. 1XD8-33 TaxID=2320081 RepID=UPI000EA2ED26|nr:hypothetical protein [Acutalibacter sp. 1XD8-33]RKJ40761.1 hypothetical protein D7X94_06805 [Acutalibacter sp. 1XD8-33]